MAKDKARDTKRVPSLGISDPISHVKKASSEYLPQGKKFDSQGRTDSVRAGIYAHRESVTRDQNAKSTPNVIKIDSSK
jgi:hypothetical protein